MSRPVTKDGARAVLLAQRQAQGGQLAFGAVRGQLLQARQRIANQIVALARLAGAYPLQQQLGLALTLVRLGGQQEGRRAQHQQQTAQLPFLVHRILPGRPAP